MAINWNTTEPDQHAIAEIIRHAKAAADDYELPYDRMELTMDITACHLNGCPLDLEKLRTFDDPNLVHDVWGIRKHIDRTTGRLMDCFVPRSAAANHR